MRFATHVETDAIYAVKLEPSSSRIPLLFLEYRFYKILGPKMGFPKVYHFGTCGKYNALVLDMLGPNLVLCDNYYYQNLFPQNANFGLSEGTFCTAAKVLQSEDNSTNSNSTD